MKKIMIVEDDKSICVELEKLLTNSGYEINIIKDFNNVKKEILNACVDLVLLDINIPGINGEMVLKELRKESNVPVIMVTSRQSEIDEALSITYGADDYIIKPYNPNILLLRIQNIFKRMQPQNSVLQYKEVFINVNKGIIKKGEQEVVLTKNEMIVFNYLLNNKERIVSRDELMTELWNNEEYINDNALTVNISRLRTKLLNLGLEDAIETRKGQGYILV